MISDNFSALKLKVASPEQIRLWSSGEVTKPETINYRTQRAEKDGLFSERIFGPTKDWECYCGKYRRIRYKGVICDKCGVEVTKSSVRRERMGHIELAVPVAHVWFLKSIPSRIGLFLNVPQNQLERVIYYTAYMIIKVNEEGKEAALKELEAEYKNKKSSGKSENDLLEELYKQRKDELQSIVPFKIISEKTYFELSKKFGHIFEAGIGGEAVQKLLEEIDLKEMEKGLEAQLEKTKGVAERRKIIFRLKLARSFVKNDLRPEWMFLTVLPVLPPDLRPMVALDGGRYATSDLNDLYRRVINRNNRLRKLLELKAPEVIVRNEKRMLQEAVDALLDNTSRENQAQMTSQKRPLKSLADILKGKSGRFRQNLLGKRVDYSARSVIVVGPKLRHFECGLPKKMALELFRPFIINNLIYKRELAHNIRGANRLIDQAPTEVWEALEEEIQDKLVLLNRAPTLHRLGIQAFKPSLIEDMCIRIPPMVCAAFNADFDGDQMAVHLPLSDEAQKEAREIMLSSHNFLLPSSGDPIVDPNQDIVLGCYYLTKISNPDLDEKEIKAYSSFEEVKYAYELGYLGLGDLIKVPNSKDSIIEMNLNSLQEKKDKDHGLIKTTVGRLIFNEIFPADFPFVNELANKGFLQNLVDFISVKLENVGEAVDIIDKIKAIGFRYATISGITWSMDDLKEPGIKKKSFEEAALQSNKVEGQYQEGLLSTDERKAHIIYAWQESFSKVNKDIRTSLDNKGSVFSIIDSKARGSWNQLSQMMGAKGFVQNPKGDLIEMPIKHSYKEGFTILEYFIASHGARKGTSDTALKTATAGYLTRRLVDTAQDVIIMEDDCKTKEGLEVVRGKEGFDNFSFRIFSRTACETVKIKNKIIVKAGEIIDRKTSKLIESEKSISSVKVRSPITCKSVWGICSKCYGYNLAYNKPVKIGAPVGILAAQSIGEPGTQLTMRTFHTGGVAGRDITHGLPRIEELFEIRTPKYKATIANVPGEIVNIEENEKEILVDLKPLDGKEDKKTTKKSSKTKKSEIELITFKLIKTSRVLVKKGDKLAAGDKITEGSIDLKELMKVAGRMAVEKYVMDEVQQIYISQGVNINNKHLEIILRQMFSKVKIKESGDSDFLAGEVISKSKLLKENRKLKKEGKAPAKGVLLLLGITKSALASDSFLSAVSFQDTTRVLVSAATEGKVDNLRGLKENVIIGRLIPAGTGFKTEDDVEEEEPENPEAFEE